VAPRWLDLDRGACGVSSGPHRSRKEVPRLAVAQHAAARLGELHAARLAHEHGHAELGLEVADALGQRRLGDVQLLGGAREVARPRGREERIELQRRDAHSTT
jgi:hypothetical protein